MVCCCSMARTKNYLYCSNRRNNAQEFQSTRIIIKESKSVYYETYHTVIKDIILTENETR